jgi:purine nucleosidase/pyrimidine-specific ribonucleoside hydrolase
MIMRKLLIDCDPGIDDAVALLLAIRSGRLDIKAITTVSGNLTADRCSINARRVLELVGRPSIPVTPGPMSPLVRPFPADPFSHGGDGLADVGLPPASLPEQPGFAPDVIVDLVNAHAGDITLVALGPLTNIALALMRDPSLASKVDELVMIGGTYGFHGAGALRATGVNPVSEWNIYVDPEAAHIVFNSGLPIRAIGLDIVGHPDMELSAGHRSMLRDSATQAAKFLLSAADFVKTRGFGSYTSFIDAAAIAYVLDPSLFTMQTLEVAVETQSPLSRGQVIVERRQHFRWTHLPKIQAASDMDFARYLTILAATL